MTSVLLRRADVAIAAVACRHRCGRGRDGDAADHHALVFVRRGCFVRSVDGVAHTLDPTRAYGINPGQEQRYDHPHDHGDDCTAITLDPTLLASLWGGDPHELTERAIRPDDPDRSLPDLGFADQSHLCRVIRSETGHTPSALRSALA